MYSSLVTGTVSPEFVSDVLERWKIAAESFKKAKGYQSGYLMINKYDGKAHVFSLWASEEDANAFETSGEYQEVMRGFISLMTSMPVREVCEIIASVENK